MNFDINSFFKFIGSIYKVSFIIFLSGLFMILSNDEVREVLFLKDFIKTYGVYIGFTTVVSGIILTIYVFESIVSFIKRKYGVSKSKLELIKILKDLSLNEKRVLAHFLVNKTQVSNLGIQYQSLDEPESVGMLMAKGFLYTSSVGLNPYYHLDSVIWDLLQEETREILYEDIFWKTSNQ